MNELFTVAHALETGGIGGVDPGYLRRWQVMTTKNPEDVDENVKQAKKRKKKKTYHEQIPTLDERIEYHILSEGPYPKRRIRKRKIMAIRHNSSDPALFKDVYKRV